MDRSKLTISARVVYKIDGSHSHIELVQGQNVIKIDHINNPTDRDNGMKWREVVKLVESIIPYGSGYGPRATTQE